MITLSNTENYGCNSTNDNNKNYNDHNDISINIIIYRDIASY